MAEIDTTNKFLVSAGASADGSRIRIMMPTHRPLSVDDALNLAAWLVAVSGEKDRFDKIYEAVCST